MFRRLIGVSSVVLAFRRLLTSVIRCFVSCLAFRRLRGRFFGKFAVSSVTLAFRRLLSRFVGYAGVSSVICRFVSFVSFVSYLMFDWILWRFVGCFRVLSVKLALHRLLWRFVGDVASRRLLLVFSSVYLAFRRLHGISTITRAFCG